MELLATPLRLLTENTVCAVHILHCSDLYHQEGQGQQAHGNTTIYRFTAKAYTYGLDFPRQTTLWESLHNKDWCEGGNQESYNYQGNYSKEIGGHVLTSPRIPRGSI